MVTITKRCKRHGIDLPVGGEMVASFKAAFPEAVFDDEHQEWRLPWERDTIAESTRRLEQFFAEREVGVTHVDRC
jgi:hypothetical protein